MGGGGGGDGIGIGVPEDRREEFADDTAAVGAGGATTTELLGNKASLKEGDPCCVERSSDILELGGWFSFC